MSKAKNKKQKQSEQQPLENANVNETPVVPSETASRTPRNENMFRMWNARPTQIPSVPKDAKGKPTVNVAAVAKNEIDWKAFSISATIVCIVALCAHITGLFGQFVLNDQLLLAPLNIGRDSDVFWSRLVARGLATPLSNLWTNVGLATDLRSGSIVWFHMVNLCLHAVTSFYLFTLLFQLGRYWKFEERTDVKPEHFALAAACIFACHPLASEVVSYIPGREAVLVGANYMLALAFFFAAFVARSPGLMVTYYVGMFAAVVMAAFSSPSSVTIPLALLTLALLAKPPEMNWNEFSKMRWPDLTIIGMLAAGFGYLIYKGIPTALNNGIGLACLPTNLYIASEFKAFATYFLRCFLVPAGLSVEPPYVVSTGFTDPLTLLGVASIAGIAYLTYRFRNIPPVVFGLSLTLIGLLPDFVLPQPEIVSDARFYISLAGLAIVVGWGIAKLALTNFKQMAIASLILVLGLAGLSNWRALAWQSDEGLWTEILKTNPQSARSHAKLGFLHLLAKKVPDAKKEIETALKIDPQSALAHLASGRVKQIDGDEAEAYKEFETALKLAKDSNTSPIIIAQCQAQVADSLVRQGNYAGVKELVDEALSVLGESAQLHYLMGMCLLNEKKYVLAINELQQGFIQDQKNAQYVEPLAAAYLGSRLPTLIPQAYKLLEHTTAQFPTSQGLLLYARAAIELNRIDQAKTLIEQGAKIGGDSAEANYLRFFVAKAQKNYPQAQAFKAKALQQDPKIETNVPVVDPENIQKYLQEEERKANQSKAPVAVPAQTPSEPPATQAPAEKKPEEKASTDAKTPETKPATEVKPAAKKP